MAQMASDRVGNSLVPRLWRVVPGSGGLGRSGSHLELLLLGAGVAASSSTFCLAAASCSCWAPLWMVAAGARATTLRGRTGR